MAIDGLKIIGESINDSVPSTHSFYETGNWDGIGELARTQEANGASYLDVNVGSRSQADMEQAIQIVQANSSLPLSIDSPDFELASVGLKSYDLSRGKPILNSISPLRPEMFDLYKIKPFRPILLISEFVDSSGQAGPARTAEETFAAARDLFDRAQAAGIPNDDLIFDPGIAPIGSDLEGNLVRLIKVLELIQNTPEMAGVHASVGLSNFTVMLPSKTKKSGLSVKSSLESAFLTIAMPLGLDFVVGSVKRKYEKLDEEHPAMKCVRNCLATEGMPALAGVRRFYMN